LMLEDGWKSLQACKGSAESDDSFMKKVKKQIPFVLFEDQAKLSIKAKAGDEKLQSKVEKESCERHDVTESASDDTAVIAASHDVTESVKDDAVIAGGDCVDHVAKKRRKAKAGPASKVKRARSESPSTDMVESIEEEKDGMKSPSLDITVPFVENIPENLIDNDDMLDDTVGLGTEYFEVFPKEEENVEIEVLPEIDMDDDDDIESEDDKQYAECDEERRVLVFNLNPAESHSSCKSFFSRHDCVEHIKRTKTRKNSYSEAMKYKGVYLITFETEEAAEEFLKKKVIFKNVVLVTKRLDQYKREKFFQRQVQRCRVVQKKHQEVLSELKDLKKSGKLNNCVSVQIPLGQVSDEQVQEYFCGSDPLGPGF